MSFDLIPHEPDVAVRTEREVPLMSRKTVTAGVVAALLSSVVILAGVTPAIADPPGTVQVLATDPNGSTRLTESTVSLQTGTSTAATTFTVDTSTTYQSIVGFGASMTDSSAFLIDERLDSTRRAQLMSDLFDPTTGIGISMLRQPMGATDFNAPNSGLYTFDDRPCTSPDPGQVYFSIAHDQSYILPLLREAQDVSDDITFMATPWSPPAWMRDMPSTCTTRGQLGGKLQDQYLASYAQYFVKFLQGYAAEGVPISYVTPQNEPTNELLLLPSMEMPAAQAATFIHDYLAPAIASAGLDTEILGWDFVWDQSAGYPTTLLGSAAAPDITGTAWHCYGGTPDAMSTIHDLAPTKDVFVTECSGLRTNPPGEIVVTDQSQFKKTMNLFVNSTRNWARSVILWNIALDSFDGPTTGCVGCRPLVHIDYSLFEGWVASKQIEYYAVGQVAKWVRPGAVRVDSTTSASGINNVTFVNTDGSKVLVAVNNGSSAQTFGVQQGSNWFSYTLAPGAAATFRWTT